MPNQIPLAEMQADFVDTESDIEALSNIVSGLEQFIARAGGEDRSAFKVDRLKYASLLNQAHRLKQIIQERITNART